MDIKRDLLIFLYDNRQSLRPVVINPVFKDCGLRHIDIRYLLRDLKDNGIIQIANTYNDLGNSPAPRNGQPRIVHSMDNMTIEAKLTPIIGEQFVKDNFLQKHQPTTNIQAHQVIYNTGQINAPISQTDNPMPNKTSVTTFKNIFLFCIKTIWNNIIIVVIATLISGYIIYRLGWTGQYIEPSGLPVDTTTVVKTITDK